MKIISPSILSADFACLKDDLARVKNADWLHIDVMDGVFVPNISYGFPVISAIRRLTGQMFDTHLMIKNPLEYIKAFADAGSDIIVFHIESSSPVKETIEQIKQCGKKAGLALKPATPFEAVKPYIKDIELLLIMTVEPGFGGQTFMSDMLAKISEAREYINKAKNKPLIEVDGGINAETAGLCSQAGADVIVAGSYVFSSDSPKAAIEELRNI